MHYLAAAILLICVSNVLANTGHTTEATCVPDAGLTYTIWLTRVVPNNPADPCNSVIYTESFNALFPSVDSPLPPGCYASIVDGMGVLPDSRECEARGRTNMATVDVHYDVLIRCEPTPDEVQAFFETRVNNIVYFIQSNEINIVDEFNGGRVRVSDLESTGRGTGGRGRGTGTGGRGRGTGGTGTGGRGRGTGSRGRGRTRTGASMVVGFCNNLEIDVSIRGINSTTCADAGSGKLMMMHIACTHARTHIHTYTL